jgi:ubiquinone biosynthesis protein COQ4
MKSGFAAAILRQDRPVTDDQLQLPAGASQLTRLRVAMRALRRLAKNAEDTVAAPALSMSLNGKVARRHVRRLAKTRAGRDLLSERPSLQRKNIDLEALAQLPEGTVGRAFARYFMDNKTRPFETPWETPSDGDYVLKWYRETHDIHHIVTGYGTDVVGEMELQAFSFGNLGLPSSRLALFFGVVLTPRGMPPVGKHWRRLVAAYRRGKRTESLLGVRYDQYLDQPVAALRQALRVPPMD